MSTPKDEVKSAARGNGEVVLCPSCMTGNHPRADFCHKCGMPLSSFATMDPLKRIYAQGWIYRKAISGRTSPIVFWGMWLIFGPTVIFVAFGLLGWFRDIARGASYTVFDSFKYADEGMWIVGFTVSASLVLLYGAILFRVTKSYIRYRGHQPGCCEECGYKLRGLPEPRCPECGMLFDPEDVFDESDSHTDEESLERPVGWVDVSFAVAVLSCYLLLVASARLDDLLQLSTRLSEDCALVFGTSAVAINIGLWIIGLKFILSPERANRSWVFWVAFAANILFLPFSALREI